MGAYVSILASPSRISSYTIASVDLYEYNLESLKVIALKSFISKLDITVSHINIKMFKGYEPTNIIERNPELKKLLIEQMENRSGRIDFDILTDDQTDPNRFADSILDILTLVPTFKFSATFHDPTGPGDHIYISNGNGKVRKMYADHPARK